MKANHIDSPRLSIDGAGSIDVTLDWFVDELIRMMVFMVFSVEERSGRVAAYKRSGDKMKEHSADESKSPSEVGTRER